VDGKKMREIHLCEDCYREKVTPVQKVVDFADLLKTMIEGTVKDQGAAAKAICPACGISLAEFRASGRFGCPNDYKIFQEPVAQLLEKIQHATRHVGRTPPNAGAGIQRENTLLRLRRELERAVQREAYEEAARLRDQIRTLTGGPA